MYIEIYLASFIERLNSNNVIFTTPFLVLYGNNWFTEVGKMLNEEISHNISLIPTKDDFEYLETVKNSIMKNIIQYDISLIFNKWNDKYDLSKYNFPFIENNEVKEILATSMKRNDLDYIYRSIVKNMQMDFYSYAAMIEVQKMVVFIDGLIVSSKKNSDIKKVYKNEIWFIIGLLFANGEMENLLTEFKSNCTQIAKKLGNEKGFRPYISESIGTKHKTSTKSIFSDKSKTNKILSHCKENNIDVTPYFLERLPSE